MWCTGSSRASVRKKFPMRRPWVDWYKRWVQRWLGQDAYWSQVEPFQLRPPVTQRRALHGQERRDLLAFFNSLTGAMCSVVGGLREAGQKDNGSDEIFDDQNPGKAQYTILLEKKDQ